MNSEQKNRHRVFGLVVKKSNNLRRRISQFRTKDGQVFNLDVIPNLEDPVCFLDFMWVDKKVGLVDETYYFHLKNGDCEVATECDTPSLTGRKRRVSERKRYTAKEISAGVLKEQLDFLVKWLEDPETVRINPYTEEVLTEEETDIDQWLGSVTTALDKYRIDLVLTPLQPGINKVRESTVSFDTVVRPEEMLGLNEEKKDN